MGADSLLGKTFDEYRIEKPLGAGGMAKVYRALDVKLKRYAALKVIAPDLRNDSGYAARFEREAQSIARLEHPNIVQIYRFGEANGLYYMAMQYIEGADLGWLIRDYRRASEVMPIGDIVRVMQEIGAALDFAHSRDVIHRDVKPSNIMVDNRGRALLTDFGLALLGDVGTRGEIFGSPHYVAPEQTVSSANVLPQSDIYSLGITLFEMLTGELPFTGGEPLEISMRHLSEQPPAPSQFNATIPASVDEVVLRALEKEPFDRYPTCADFSSALQAAVEDFQVRPQASMTPVLRPSLVLIPQKVHAHLQATPIPPTPPPAASAVPPAPETAPLQSFPVTPSQAGAATLLASNRPSAANWKRAILFACMVFLIGVILIFVLLKARDQGEPPSAVSLPTSTSTELIVVLQAASPTTLPTLTLSSTPLPTFTLTPLPTLPPTAAPTLRPPTVPAPTQAPKQYTLLLGRHKDQSLFIVNIGLDPFPLSGLRLSGDHGSVTGAEWNVDALNNGDCVSIWKQGGKSEAPDITCSEKGDRLMRPPPQAFWKTLFTIFYNDAQIATCNQDTCIVQIQGP